MTKATSVKPGSDYYEVSKLSVTEDEDGGLVVIRCGCGCDKNVLVDNTSNLQSGEGLTILEPSQSE